MWCNGMYLGMVRPQYSKYFADTTVSNNDQRREILKWKKTGERYKSEKFSFFPNK